MSPRQDFHNLGVRFLENRNRTLLLSALAGFGLAICLIGKLVFSGYSIMDDHEIVQWLGPDRHLALSRVWSTLMSTEVGNTAGRFRPVMYSLIVIQTWLWGPHPAGYHVAAILWFGVFLWSIAWVTFRSIGILAGGAILFLIVDAHYWPDIITHSTFVSEQPALLGLGLIVFGFGLTSSWFINGCRGRLDGAVLLVSIGSLICAGAKENFLPPTALSLVLLTVAWRMKKIGIWSLALSTIVNFLAVETCLRIIVPNFGQQADLSFRLRAVCHSSLFKYVILALVSGAAAAALGIGDMVRRDSPAARAIVVLGAFLLVAGLYLAWEIFFYDGRQPYGSDGLMPYGQRYDFPALLIYPILAGAGFFAVTEATKRNVWLASRFSPLALQLCFVLLILNVATAYYVRRQLLPIISAIAISNSHTHKMADDLAAAKAMAAQHPDWPILVAPTRAFDYEAVVTIPIWFQFYQIANPESLVLDIPPQNMTTPPERQLVDSMRRISLDGSQALRYRPTTAALVESEQAKGQCYVVTTGNFGGRCVRLPYRPNLYYPEL